MGATCVVIAGGPGLEKPRQLLHVAERHVKTIVINATYKDYAQYGTPDVVYMGDFMAWKVYGDDVKKRLPKAERWTQDRTAALRWQLQLVKGVNREGLGRNGVIHLGGNSGYQAMNLAFHWGVKKLILLGFTMRVVDGKQHHHPDHPMPLIQRILPEEWVKKMGKLAADLKAAGVDVVNCDALSVLDCFRRSTLEQELA